MTGKPTKPKQVMDISRPGTSASHPTSRPIIVTNRPVLKDPIVVAEEEAANSTKTAVGASVTGSKIKIEPLHADVKPEADVDNDKAPADALTDAPVLPVEEIDEPEAEKGDEPESAIDEPATTEAGVEEPAESGSHDGPAQPEDVGETEPRPVEGAEASDSLPDDGDDATNLKETADHDAQLADLGKPDPEAVKAAREAAEKQLALDKLVAEETYFLPIDRSGKRRTQRILLVTGFVLCLILALVAVDLLLDAGLLSIDGVKAPTNFIYNK